MNTHRPNQCSLAISFTDITVIGDWTLEEKKKKSLQFHIKLLVSEKVTASFWPHGTVLIPFSWLCLLYIAYKSNVHFILIVDSSSVKLLYFFNVHFCDHTHQVEHRAKCSRLKETVVQKCI